MLKIVTAVFVGALALGGCGGATDDDNSPAIFFDDDEQRAERNARRAESPGAKISGKMYKFIDASIDGKMSAPVGDEIAVLTLENGLIKGYDGCTRFSGRGGFTPSGYEYTTRDSDPFENTDVDCSANPRFEALYELEDNVWRLSLEPNGVLVMTEYDHGKKVFRLRPRHE